MEHGDRNVDSRISDVLDSSALWWSKYNKDSQLIPYYGEFSSVCSHYSSYYTPEDEEMFKNSALVPSYCVRGGLDSMGSVDTRVSTRIFA